MVTRCNILGGGTRQRVLVGKPPNVLHLQNDAKVIPLCHITCPRRDADVASLPYLSYIVPSLDRTPKSNQVITVNYIQVFISPTHFSIHVMHTGPQSLRCVVSYQIYHSCPVPSGSVDKLRYAPSAPSKVQRICHCRHNSPARERLPEAYTRSAHTDHVASITTPCACQHYTRYGKSRCTQRVKATTASAIFTPPCTAIDVAQFI